MLNKLQKYSFGTIREPMKSKHSKIKELKLAPVHTVMLIEGPKDANTKGGLFESLGQKTIKTTFLIQKLFLGPKISK